MVLLLCRSGSNKASVDPSASLSSSKRLRKPESPTNESNFWNIVSPFQEPREQRHANQRAIHLKHDRRCSSVEGASFLSPSRLTEKHNILDDFTDSNIPAFVYIPHDVSLSSHDEEEDSSTEEEAVTTFSHEFHQWQAFPHMSDIKHHAVWGITTATVNDVMEETMRTVHPENNYCPSDEKVFCESLPHQHCSLPTCSLRTV